MNILKQKKYRAMSALVKYSFVIVLVCTVAMPFAFVGASHVPGHKDVPDTTTTGTKQTPDTTTTGVRQNPDTTTTGTSLKINTKINNPLGDSIKDIPSFIRAIINIVLTIGVPIVVLAIIYAGFLFVTAQGNEEKLKTAKKTFMYTIIGATILLGAFVIANAIRGTVEEIRRTT